MKSFSFRGPRLNGLRVVLISLFLFSLIPCLSLAQSPEAQIEQLNGELKKVRLEEDRILTQLEKVKLERLRRDLKANGLPKLEANEQLVEHAAMTLVYSEENEQAKWVAHIITPDIINGSVGRTNDFRVDPMVLTGSAEEKDYFTKTRKPDSSYTYDGYGFDRGHLAPSADFSWSGIALSESYFYSNMSPQRPEFNQGIWAELEGAIRGYVARNPDVQLYVVTGPILKPGLPKSVRSVNGVTIPEKYFKVVLDLKNGRGIGFVIPNQGSELPLIDFALSIDDIEGLTGIDFYANLPDDQESKVESSLFPQTWFPDTQAGDVDPVSPAKLKSGQINTHSAKVWMGNNKKIEVCGTVVSARYSNKGNVLLNLDKKYPNQVFTVFIKKEFLINFSYDPVEDLMHKIICIKGEVSDLGGMPALFIENEAQLRDF